MKKIGAYRFRKCYDVQNDVVYLEVLDEAETVVMDVMLKCDEIQMLFYPAITSKTICFSLLEKLKEEAAGLLRAESN
jgi:hypothetical protein